MSEWITVVGCLAVIMPLTRGYVVQKCFPGGRQGDLRALHSDGRPLSCSYAG